MVMCYELAWHYFVEDKLHELAERREQLTTDLAATVHNIQRIQRLASKAPVALRPTGKQGIGHLVFFKSITAMLQSKSHFSH